MEKAAPIEEVLHVPGGWSFQRGRFRILGIRLVNFRGIEVWVHWVLVLLLVLLLVGNFIQIPGVEAPLLNWVVLVTTLVGSILLHELGHILVARALGGCVERIVLWPLGGLADCSVPEGPSPQFLAAAGGPAANLTLFGVAGLVCTTAGWELSPGPVWAPAVLVFQWLFLWNGILLLANSLPCTPLDGGRMFQAVLWGRLGDREEAERVSVRLGHVVATLAVVGALCIFFTGFADREYLGRHPFLANLQWALVLLGVVHLLETKMGGSHLLREDAEEHGIFGYDFSGGYTSLERTATRESRPPATHASKPPATRETRPPSAWTRLRARFRGKAEVERNDVEDEERLDRILEKIHAQGLTSLTREDRKFLEKMSRRLRK